MNAAIDRQAAAKATESEGLTVEEARRLMADPDSFDEQERAATALQGSATASGAEGLGSDPVFDSVIAHPGWITHIKDFVAQERTVFTNGGGIVLRWPGEKRHGWTLRGVYQGPRHPNRVPGTIIMS